MVALAVIASIQWTAGTLRIAGGLGGFWLFDRRTISEVSVHGVFAHAERVRDANRVPIGTKDNAARDNLQRPIVRGSKCRGRN